MSALEVVEFIFGYSIVAMSVAYDGWIALCMLIVGGLLMYAGLPI